MLRQRFLVQFGSQFILKIVGMIAGIIVARFAGPEVLGTLAFGTAYVSVFGFMISFFSTGHIKAISEGEDLGACVSTYTILKGFSILVFVIVVLGWFVTQKHILNYDFESREQELVILILLAAFVAAKVLDFGNVTFTAKLEQAKANYPIFIKNLLHHAGRIILVVLGVKAVGLASWQLIITIFVIPIGWRFFKKLPWGGFSKRLAKRYWLIGIPMFLYFIITSLIANADRLILVHFTTVEELGYYSAAYAIGGMFLLISASVGQIFFPMFSRLIKDNLWKTVNDKINSYQRFVAISIFPALCTIALIGESFLLFILGERYQPSVNPFIILLFATYVTIQGMPYGNIITGMGKFHAVPIIHLIKLLFFIVFLIFLISPDYLGLGATGLAINLLVINVVTNAMFLGFSAYFGHVKIKKNNILKHFFISLFFLCIHYIVNAYSFDQGYWWILIGPTALILCYFLLFMTKLMLPSDIKQLLDLANLRKTRDYIEGEFRK